MQKISKNRQEFIRYIEEITIVARLFDLEVGEKMDWMMKIIEETFPFKEGLKRGEKRGEKKGEIKGLQEAILLDIRVKFGKGKAQLVKPKIQKIENIRELKALHTKIIKAENWNDVLKYLNSALNKSTNSNSKIKGNKK